MGIQYTKDNFSRLDQPPNRKGVRLMAAMNINEAQLHDLIKSNKTILVDFWAPWCGDCRRIAGAYDQIADEYAAQMTVVKINVDEIEGIREREEIRRIPTLRLYQNGKALGQIVEPPAKADIDAFVGAAPQFDAPEDPYTDLFTVQLSLAGLPSITVPFGNDGQRLPVSVQLTGPRFSERLLLCAGRLLELSREAFEACTI